MVHENLSFAVLASPGFTQFVSLVSCVQACLSEACLSKAWLRSLSAPRPFTRLHDMAACDHAQRELEKQRELEREQTLRRQLEAQKEVRVFVDSDGGGWFSLV